METIQRDFTEWEKERKDQILWGISQKNIIDDVFNEKYWGEE